MWERVLGSSIYVFALSGLSAGIYSKSFKSSQMSETESLKMNDLTYFQGIACQAYWYSFMGDLRSLPPLIALAGRINRRANVYEIMRQPHYILSFVL